MGLLYVGAFLRKLGYELQLIDCLDKYHPGLLKIQKRTTPKLKKFGIGPFHRVIVEKPSILNFVPRHYARYGWPEELFVDELQKIAPPDAVLVTSLMTYWYPGPAKIVEWVRRIFPGIPVILGGIYATLLPEHARKVVKPDYLISGPGEIEVARLLESILPHAPSLDDLPVALDDFPPPAFDLYPRMDYLVVLTSRGCPYRCTFCATDKISGRFAQRQPAKVVEEILTQSRRFRVKDIAFYDDALLLNKKKHIIPILEQMLSEKISLRFHTPNGLHCKEIDAELSSLFFRCGFTTIRLSFETVNPERQADMKNKVTPHDLEAAVQNLEAAGYKRKSLEAYVLMELPHQSPQEIYESILFVHSLGIRVKLASFSPIPGTVDFDRVVQQGLFPADADPLLTNKSIYPLHRSSEAYRLFHQIRQLSHVLNQAVERGVTLFSEKELRAAIKKFL
ncbi:MAG: B12-binding domain-containing radical SAM protein [Calditrichia bacterium]